MQKRNSADNDPQGQSEGPIRPAGRRQGPQPSSRNNASTASGGTSLSIKSTQKPFDDVRVRRALALAIAWAAYVIARSLPYWPIDVTLPTSAMVALELDTLRIAFAILPAAVREVPLRVVAVAVLGLQAGSLRPHGDPALPAVDRDDCPLHDGALPEIPRARAGRDRSCSAARRTCAAPPSR